MLVSFPFTDGTSSKLRPALVVALSQRHQDDELDTLTSQPDFAISGLKVSSRLRLTRMTTLAMPPLCCGASAPCRRACSLTTNAESS